MKKIKWNQEKNELLIKTRGVAFEEVALAIEESRTLGLIEHPSRSNQFILTVLIKDYPWDVPFIVEADGSWFLKTVYPNRKRKK